MKLCNNLKILGLACFTLFCGGCAPKEIPEDSKNSVVSDTQNSVADGTQNLPEWIQERRAKPSESFKFFAPALSWRIKEIALNWDYDATIQTVLREEIAKSGANEEIVLTESGYRRETSKIKRIEDRTGLSFSAEQAAKCFKIFTGSIPVPECTYEHVEHKIFEKSYVKFDGERKTASDSIRNWMERVCERLESKTIKNPKLTIDVDLINRTKEPLLAKEFALPILLGDRKLGDAVERDGGQTIHFRGDGVTPLVFDYPLNDTRSLTALPDIGSVRVDVLKSVGTFVTDDSNCDLLREVSDDRKLFVVGATEAGIIHFRDNGQPNKVRVFVEALNNQIDAKFIGVDSGFSNTCLEFVSGAKSDMDGCWCICALDNLGEKKVLSLDSDLPVGKNIIICKMNPNEVKRSWFEAGTESGNALAFYWAGYCWENGIDGEADFNRAIERFSKAVELGFSGSTEFQERMGYYYVKGKIGEKDFSKEYLQAWREVWLNAMSKKVDEFLKEIKDLSVEDMFGKLDCFLKKNEENPYKNKASEHVFNSGMEFFSSKLGAWDGSEESYKGIESVCNAVLRTSSPIIKSNKLYSFATLYVSWLKSYSRDVMVHAIAVRRPDSTYVKKIECKGGCTKKFDKYSRSGSEFTFKLDFPWEKVVLIHHKNRRGKVVEEVIPGLGELKRGDYVVREIWQLRVTIKPLEGKTIHELWAETK